ncbi:transcriptional regulator [Prosthecomicrobium hirschii]|uniref:GntR family transcriptional regulator n=1 Tax=Prosthecodimorpha hirschii TaxID=665126 RepID=UPI00112A1B83|nr:GntR family transcriptional regulator [Prosthecomicrobium hirschii]TPQ48987.1 transcriptional regulator [Prosthecomicrobium hirschii]
MTDSEPTAVHQRRDDLDKVIALLEEDIIFGRLAPGSRLTEDTLMARYDASRHFVRQSLMEMERRGIVLREKNIGATVRSFSAEEVRQIYDVREMLTRQVALMTPLPAPNTLIDHLRALQERYRDRVEKLDLRGIHDANDAFHIALFEACGNPYLVRTLRDYMDLTLPIRAKNLAAAEGLRISVAQHDVMIDLLRGRDAWALAQLCVDHIQASKADYLRRIASNDRAGAGTTTAQV